VRPLAIQAVGAFTGAGTSAARALGSLRLALKFFGELPTLDADGAPVIGAPTPLDLDEVEGAERLVTMAALALAECATKHDYPAAVLLCLPDVGAFSSDASGDRFGLREAGMALARLRPRAQPAPEVWYPAACTGELGAASGPFALAAAATFLHRRVSAGPAALVLGTSDGAARGAAVVSVAPPPGQPPKRR
jgi:hypothetical protein